MDDAVSKVSSHLRRVGGTRWLVKAYQRNAAQSLQANQPGLPGVAAKPPKPESEVARLIRKALANQQKK